jgi:hypothetical protein
MRPWKNLSTYNHWKSRKTIWIQCNVYFNYFYAKFTLFSHELQKRITAQTQPKVWKKFLIALRTQISIKNIINLFFDFSWKRSNSTYTAVKEISKNTKILKKELLNWHTLATVYISVRMQGLSAPEYLQLYLFD